MPRGITKPKSASLKQKNPFPLLITLQSHDRAMSAPPAKACPAIAAMVGNGAFISMPQNLYVAYISLIPAGSAPPLAAIHPTFIPWFQIFGCEVDMIRAEVSVVPIFCTDSVSSSR